MVKNIDETVLKKQIKGRKARAIDKGIGKKAEKLARDVGKETVSIRGMDQDDVRSYEYSNRGLKVFFEEVYYDLGYGRELKIKDGSKTVYSEEGGMIRSYIPGNWEGNLESDFENLSKLVRRKRDRKRSKEAGKKAGELKCEKVKWGLE